MGVEKANYNMMLRTSTEYQQGTKSIPKAKGDYNYGSTRLYKSSA